MGTLAAAYGVERDFEQVCNVAAQRVASMKKWRTSPFDRNAVSQVLGIIVQDGRNLGRVYRGSQLGPPFTNKAVVKLLAAWPLQVPATDFLEAVLSDIRSALTESEAAEAGQPGGAGP